MVLKTFHAGASRNIQGLYRSTTLNLAGWSLFCLLVILLGYSFLRPMRRPADNRLVTQEIRYHLPEASKVFLVWGVEGWNLAPAKIRPASTVVKDKLMHTPMHREGDKFVARVQVPAGTTLDYAFYIVKESGGAATEFWDTNIDPEQDYHTIAVQDGVVEIQAFSGVVEFTTNERSKVNFLHLGLLLMGVSVIFGVVILGTGLFKPHTVASEAVQEILVRVGFSIRWVLVAVTAITLLNIFVLGGTWLFTVYYRSLSSNWSAGSPIKYLLVHFNLATENVAASWYSSMLLLLVSILAVFGFIIDQKHYQSARERYLSFGWFVIALVFAGLSLDELGSLHERIGMLATLNPFGDYSLGWVKLLALPIGFVAIFMLAFGWVHIKHRPAVFVLMILGTALFLSIPVQEHFEIELWHAVSGGESWQRPILHILLEEGTELFGSLSFFSAIAVYIISPTRRGNKAAISPPPAIEFTVTLKIALAGLVVFISLLGLGLIAVEFAKRYLVNGDTGIPQNWFPSALAALTALLFFQVWDMVPRTFRSQRLLYLISALFSLLLSIYYGAGLQAWFSAMKETGPFLRLVVDGSLVITAVILSVMLAQHVEAWWSRIGTVAWSILFGLALSLGRSYAGPLDFMALAVLLPSLLAHLHHWQPQKETSPIRTDSAEIHFVNSFYFSQRLLYLYDLLRELVVRDMKLRYKRSVLGLAWSLLNPLAQLLVFQLVFSLILPLNIPNYPSFLFTGLLVWTWFQSSLFSATGVIIDNPDLIRRPGFPVAILPVVTVTTHLIHFLLALPILFVFLLSSGLPITNAALILPLIIGLQFVLTLSLAYLVAALHVIFRDTQYLLGIILLLGFYLSPVFYKASTIPEPYQPLYRLNPMVDLIRAYRAVLMQGQLPDYLPLLVLGLLSIGFLWLGYQIFTRMSYRFVEEL